MSPDEIAMVRTIERMIGQQIPRISVPGYDFGTGAGPNGSSDSVADAPAELPTSIEPGAARVSEVNVAGDPVATRKRYRRTTSVARRR
jgi:hypothetical protein